MNLLQKTILTGATSMLLGCFTFTISHAQQDPSSYSIYGTVVDTQTGQSIKNAKVVVMRNSGKWRRMRKDRMRIDTLMKYHRMQSDSMMRVDSIRSDSMMRQDRKIKNARRRQRRLHSDSIRSVRMMHQTRMMADSTMRRDSLMADSTMRSYSTDMRKFWNNMHMQTTTDDEGTFAIHNVSTGKYLIKVMSNNYKPDRQKFRLRGNMNIGIQLKPRR